MGAHKRASLESLPDTWTTSVDPRPHEPESFAHRRVSRDNYVY